MRSARRICLLLRIRSSASRLIITKVRELTGRLCKCSFHHCCTNHAVFVGRLYIRIGEGKSAYYVLFKGGGRHTRNSCLPDLCCTVAGSGQKIFVVASPRKTDVVLSGRLPRLRNGLLEPINKAFCERVEGHGTKTPCLLSMAPLVNTSGKIFSGIFFKADSQYSVWLRAQTGLKQVGCPLCKKFRLPGSWTSDDTHVSLVLECIPSPRFQVVNS